MAEKKEEERINYDYMFKLLLIGDSSVGKSSLLLRFADDTFNGAMIQTIGIDFKSRIIEVDEKQIKLQVWDTAGQERFRTITKTYFRGAMGMLLVYDVTNESTFTHLNYWLTEVKKTAIDSVIVMLVGNKCDLVEQKVITTEKAQQFANSQNLTFIETSAKDGLNVEEAFTTLAKAVKTKLIDGIDKKKEKDDDSVSIKEEEGESKCCN